MPTSGEADRRAVAALTSLKRLLPRKISRNLRPWAAARRRWIHFQRKIAQEPIEKKTRSPSTTWAIGPERLKASIIPLWTGTALATGKEEVSPPMKVPAPSQRGPLGSDVRSPAKLARADEQCPCKGTVGGALALV